jgi:mono/diheme cytochrome c family protein
MKMFAILTAAGLAMAAWAAVPTSAQQAYSGSADYQVFCSSCHGAAAKGDGVIAKSLPKRPADLTQLTVRNKGVFPQDKVVKTIDGRDGTSAHGNSDMPAWGDVFAKSTESLGAEASTSRIAELVSYLKSLQEKP